MDWVVVVDDDVTNLKMAGRILSSQKIKGTDVSVRRNPCDLPDSR